MTTTDPSSNRMIEAFREDVRRLDKGHYDDRVVLTCYQAKKILAEIDALMPPSETTTEHSLTSLYGQYMRRNHFGMSDQVRFGIESFVQWVVSQSELSLVTDRVQGVDCPECEDGTPHRHAVEPTPQQAWPNEISRAGYNELGVVCTQSSAEKASGDDHT